MAKEVKPPRQVEYAVYQLGALLAAERREHEDGVAVMARLEGPARARLADLVARLEGWYERNQRRFQPHGDASAALRQVWASGQRPPAERERLRREMPQRSWADRSPERMERVRQGQLARQADVRAEKLSRLAKQGVVPPPRLAEDAEGLRKWLKKTWARVGESA